MANLVVTPELLVRVSKAIKRCVEKIDVCATELAKKTPPMFLMTKTDDLTKWIDSLSDFATAMESKSLRVEFDPLGPTQKDKRQVKELKKELEKKKKSET